MAKAYRSTPADLYGLADYPGWCFNRAVYTFGTAVEDDLEKAGEKSRSSRSAAFKRQRALDRWLHRPGDDTRGRFKDPAASMRTAAPTSEGGG